MEVFIQDPVAPQSPPGVAPSGEGRARKERADCKVSDEGLYHAIVAHLGVLSYVAIAVGINRSALYKRIERAPALQAARDGARRMLLSRATYHLRKALHAGIDWAVHYVMCREDQLWTPFNEPQPPTEAQANRAPREPKLEEAEEVEEQPERAGKSLRRLIRAVERGEPWAVKYCLNHLDPRGRYAKKSCGRKAEATVGQVAPQPPVVIDEVAAELAKAVFDAERGRGTGQRQKQVAPPVLASDNRPADEPTTVVETAQENTSPAQALMSEAACQEGAMTSSAHAQQPLVSAPTLETESAPTVSVNGQNLNHEFAPTVDVGFTHSSTSRLPTAAPLRTAIAPEPFTPTLDPAPTLDAAPLPNSAPTKPIKCSPSPKRKQQKAQSRDRTRKRRVRPLSTKKRSHVRRSHSKP